MSTDIIPYSFKNSYIFFVNCLIYFDTVPYTDKKDRVLENRVEDVFDKNNIFYNKSEVWINSEKLYEVIYSFEMEV